MLVTTSSRVNDKLEEKAVSIAESYGLQYVPRQKRSLEHLLGSIDPQVFVVNEARGLSYYEKGKSEAFFHPNIAFLRIKNMERGELDSLVEVCGLGEGMSCLDATLGLASDALTMSYAVASSGKCTGVEKSRSIYILVKEGLARYAELNPNLRETISRIDIHNGDNLEFMQSCADKSYDAVYFDFMFDHPNAKSHGIQVIREYAVGDKMTERHIDEAMRVARRSVVVKCDRDGMEWLVKNGFEVKKKSSKKSFYYANMIVDALSNRNS